MNYDLQSIIEKCREKLPHLYLSEHKCPDHIYRKVYRDITLQDILLVMGRDVILAGNGDIYKSYRDFEDGIIGTEYDLTKSPYDQEESILEFISKNI